MAETVNQEQTTSTPAAPAERTFTQSELDAIVVDRLGRERQKYADYEDLKVKAAGTRTPRPGPGRARPGSRSWTRSRRPRPCASFGRRSRARRACRHRC